jgi:chromosome segregation ATPase
MTGQSTSTSPYISLVNFCYQLRHENEELLETVSLKTAHTEACEKEIQLLKTRVKELEDKQAGEAEQSLADRMDVSSDRYMLLQEKMRMGSQLRELDVRVKVLDSQLQGSREQIEILTSQIEESKKTENNDFENRPGVVTQSQAMLEEENKRLRKQLETAAFILSESHGGLKKRRTETPAPVPVAPTPSTVVEISSPDSLVRSLEELTGFSIAKTDNVTTLVSAINSELVVRLRDGKLLSRENLSESALEVLERFGSVAGLLAKLTIESLETKTRENSG